METVNLSTPDGVCPCHVFHPDGTGPWPAVIMYMDGPGIRPAMLELGERLSSHGYVVVVPDLFYRSGPYEPIDPKIVWPDADLRNAHRERFMDKVKPSGAMADTAAVLSYVTTRPDVKVGGVGVVGYCMGGRLALIAAGTFPEEIVAAASYHAGGLANETFSSPHLLARQMTAKIYVAGATGDANFPDDMKARLGAALLEAGVAHKIETYPAKHGWVLRDMPVYDVTESEHHWATLVPFFDEALA